MTHDINYLFTNVKPMNKIVIQTWLIFQLLLTGLIIFDSPAMAQSGKKLKKIMVDQGQFDPNLKGIQVLEGFRAKTVASNPVVVNPSLISFSDDGKIFVLQRSPNFTGEWKESKWPLGKDNQGVSLKKPFPDKIITLRIDVKSGAWKQDKTVLEPNSPSSFVVHPPYLYLAESGTITRFKIKDDGSIDIKAENILKGCAGFYEYQLGGLCFGPDGWLYFHFPPGNSILEGSDGAKIEIIRTGGIARCKPDGKKLEVYATGIRQAEGNISFDAQGNCFFADKQISSGKKSAGMRLLHITEGFDFGWHIKNQSLSFEPDSNKILNEGDDAPFSVINLPKVHPISSHAYTDVKLPEKYKRLLLVIDEESRDILGLVPAKDKSTFLSSEYFPFITSTDPAFFPSQITQGPDGAIYVVDQGNKNAIEGSGKGGRIFKIRWQGDSDEPAIPLREINLEPLKEHSVENLISKLDSDDDYSKISGRNGLILKGHDALPSLLKFIKDEDKDSTSRLRALEALSQFWNKDIQQVFENILETGDPELQLIAAQYIGRFATPGSESAFNVLLKHLGSDSPELRNAIILALGKTNAPGAAESLVNSILFYEGSDFRTFDVFARALEFTGKTGMDRILAVGDTGVKKDIKKILEIHGLMRSTIALEGTLAWLENQNIGLPEAVDLVKSIKNKTSISETILSQLANFCSKQEGMDVLVKTTLLESLSAFPDLSFEKLEKFLEACMDDVDLRLKLTSIGLIKGNSLKIFTRKIVEKLGSQEIQDDEKLSLLETVPALKAMDSFQIITNILSGSRSQKESLRVRQTALQSLFALDPDKSAKHIQGLLDSVLFHDKLKSEALQLLSGTPTGTKVLYDYFESGKSDPALLPLISESLKTHGLKSPEGKDLNSLVLRKALLTEKNSPLTQLFEKHVKEIGSPSRGRSIFSNIKKTSCIRCHQFDGNGTPIGPDLHLKKDAEASKIARHLLSPSIETKDSNTYEIKTKNKVSYSGHKLFSDNDRVILADKDGEISTFKITDIESMVSAKTSIMPDSYSSYFSYNDLCDLISFLKQHDGINQNFSGACMVGKIDSIKSGANKSFLISAQPDGFFNLQKLGFSTSDGVSFQCEIFSNKKTKFQINILSRDVFELKLNNHPATTQPARFSETSLSFDLELNQGSNDLTIDFPKGQKLEGFHLRFTGDEIKWSSIKNNPLSKN